MEHGAQLYVRVNRESNDILSRKAMDRVRSVSTNASLLLSETSASDESMPSRSTARGNLSTAITHDVAVRRQSIGHLLEVLKAFPVANDVRSERYETTTSDGYSLSMVWYHPKETQSSAGPGTGPALLHIHGGGFIAFKPTDFHNILRNNVSLSGVPILTVDYRLAPEHEYPTALYDCYQALTWLQSHAKLLNIDPARIGVMGESAGGGLAAAVALLARDRCLKPPLAKQILVYPMLDDRNTVTKDKKLLPMLTHTWDDNFVGWAAYLGGEIVGSSFVCAYAAPARASNLSGLPSAYIDVGQLDIFLDENLEYARRLQEAGAEVEFHLYDGVPHAFEILQHDSETAAAAVTNRICAMRSF